MYTVGDTHSHMSLVGDGGEEELWHVRSGGSSVIHFPSGGWERRGGSLPCTQWETFTHVPSGGWWRRGALACTQWGTLSDTFPQWGMGEERRISAMYTQWVTLTHICSQWGMVEERRSSGMYAVGDAQ